MQKKNLAYLAVLLVFLVSCKSTKEKKDEGVVQQWEFEDLASLKYATGINTTKKGMKIALNFEFPSNYKDKDILNKTQRLFVEAFGGKDYLDETPQEAFVKLENSYLKQAEEYKQNISSNPDFFSGYYQTIATTVFDKSKLDYYITARTETQQYTGGAHGIYNISYTNIDTRTGKLITEENLFKPDAKETLTAIIKGLLEERANSGKSDAISLLDPATIAPNNNFYFTTEGITYVYNPYEVTPYSDGLVEVMLPYESVKDIISSDFSYLLK